MNSLNLRQVCGGDTIKQADFGSELAFELLDEQYVKFREPLGEAAKVILKKDNTAIYQKSVPITQNTVLFKFDKILPVGSYVLEIIVGDYVFPSNNRVIITVEQTYGDFEPEYLVKVSYEELKADVDDLKSKVTALEERPIVDTALTERVEALEAKEDKDTVYDDTNLKAQITELKNRGLCVAYMVPNSLEDPIGGGMRFKKEDSGNPVQFMYANLIGISLKDSDNQDDYIWVPAQGFVSRYLTATSSEISKQIEESAEENKRRNEAVLTILNDDISPRISKLEQKRPPYGYRLNRKADPWELIFDNGCILTFPLDTIHNCYGWNESPIKITTSRPYNASPYSTPEMIMWYVKGHRTVEYLKTSSPSSYTEFINCELKNPINDSSLYNFDNAFGDASDDTLIGKRNFVKLLYELDALIEDDLLSVGVTKKEDK